MEWDILTAEVETVGRRGGVDREEGGGIECV